MVMSLSSAAFFAENFAGTVSVFARRSSANPKKTFARCITPGGSLTCSPQVIVGMIVDHAHLRGDGFEKFCALGVALNTAGEHQQHVDLSTVERKRAH